MADYGPTTMYTLIGKGVALGFTATIDKQLARFNIATSHSDPNLTTELANADPALLNYLAGKLADAIYNVP